MRELKNLQEMAAFLGLPQAKRHLLIQIGREATKGCCLGIAPGGENDFYEAVGLQTLKHQLGLGFTPDSTPSPGSPHSGENTEIINESPKPSNG